MPARVSSTTEAVQEETISDNEKEEVEKPNKKVVEKPNKKVVEKPNKKVEEILIQESVELEDIENEA